MIRKLRAGSVVRGLRSCHGMDAGGGGVLRRNRAAPASAGEQWLAEGIAPAAGLPWIGRIGSLQISSAKQISLIKSLSAVLVASKQAVVL